MALNDLELQSVLAMNCLIPDAETALSDEELVGATWNFTGILFYTPPFIEPEIDTDLLRLVRLKWRG